MAIDYSALLFDPVYAELGVPATLTVGAAAAVTITVIDDTRPKALPISVTGTAGAVEVRSVGPGAFARVYELAQKGISPDEYMDAVLAFNGRTWVVRSWEMRGSPMGEDLGEVRFLLKAGTPPPPVTDGGPPIIDGTWLNFIDDFGAVADGVLDEATGLMTGTDNYEALSNWIAYGVAQGNTQVKLYVPPGNYHLSGNASFVCLANSMVGIKNSIVSAYGAAMDQVWIGPIGTIVNDFSHSARIASVAPGATSVTVIAAGCHPATDVSIFSAGDRVLVGALSMQVDSFPFNLQYFEFGQVTSIAGQDIDLSSALNNAILSTWPDIDTKSVAVTSGTPAVFTLNNHGMSTNQFIYVDCAVGGSVPAGIVRNQEYRLAAPTTNTFQLTLGGVPVNTTSAGSNVKIHTVGDVGGPASIVLMRPTFDCIHAMYGLRATNKNSLTSVGGRNTTVTDVTCDGLGFSPSIGADIVIKTCQIGGQNEIDKLVANLTYDTCHSDVSPGNLLFFSTSIDRATIRNCSPLNIIGTPKHIAIEDSDIGLINPGGNGYGHAETLTATNGNFGASQACSRTIDLSALTFSGGTFSAPKVSAYAMYQAIVPGKKMAFGIYAGGFVYRQDTTSAIASFTVTALRESADVIYADTDWVGAIPGNVYYGGPPTLIGNIPLDSVSVTNCTGSDLTVYDDYT